MLLTYHGARPFRQRVILSTCHLVTQKVTYNGSKETKLAAGFN
jgi:hypothetical protein